MISKTSAMLLASMGLSGVAALAFAQAAPPKLENSTIKDDASVGPPKPARNNLPPVKGQLQLAKRGADSDFALTLGEMRFDPLIDVPVAPVGWNTSSDDDHGNNLRLIQLDGPTSQQTLHALEDAGAEIIQYVYPHTYIVWSNQNSLDVADAMPSVRWTGEFISAYRVLPSYRSLDATPRSMDILMYRSADLDDTVQRIAGIGGRISGRVAIDHRFEVLGVVMPGNRIQQVAQLPGVYSIQPDRNDGGLRGEMSNQINAGNVDGSNEAFPGYAAYLSSIGVDGNGVTMANVDGGVQESHPDLVNRIIPCSGTTCSTGVSSHGTHTAGIMAADGSSGTMDSFGFLRGQGVAPGADLVVQQYSPWFQNPGGMLLLMEDSGNNGASLSGNSWGPSGSPQGYDNDTMQVDIGVRDTDDVIPGDQPLTYVLSFMNGNGGTSSQGSPDEAKNIFTIGSTKGQESSGAQILDIDDLSSNTAHGPALDGRTIPHMVAPGCRIDSSDSGSSYSLKCGTSMASPHVAGAVALFIEYYRGLDGITMDPSPALVKAAFLPVSHSLAGFSDADGGTLGQPFDSKQGWGRMNLDAVVNPPADSVRYFDNPVVFDNTGEEWSTTVSPLDPTKPMRFMLVWTDAPGHGLGGSTPAWNNNLDLVVEAGGNTYYGNNIGVSGYSDDGGSADDRNNTEGVFLGPLPPGAATVRVVAANITSDALPNSGDATDQDFAIVCYNCAVEPGFALVAEADDESICAPDSVVYQVTIEQVLGFDESVTLSTSGLPSGMTAVFADNPVVPPASTTMTLTVDGAAPAGEHSFDLFGDATGGLQRMTSASVHVSTTPPAMPVLLAPADGAVDVTTTPTFEWNDVAQATSYAFQLATDPGFTSIVLDVDTTDSQLSVAEALDTLTTYYWRVTPTNTCGDGSTSATHSMSTLDVPSLLIVDDDDNSPDVSGFYASMLDSIGFVYDVWDTENSDNEPDAATLSQYEVVLWFTGDEFGGAAGPGGDGEIALGQYLDNTGCLMISSQDYHYDRGLTTFMSTYLGVASVDNDEAQTSVDGAGPIFGELGPYSLNYPFFNYSDIVEPNFVGSTAFTGDQGNAAVYRDGGDYRTAFLVFPLEAVASDADRGEILVTFMQWCDELYDSPCPADIFNGGDGIVDVQDLLELLGNWGTGGPGAELAAPFNVVDTADLLAMLFEFGPCD